MSSILARHPYTDCGWRYMRVGGSRVAHLVPARLGPMSRTACHRLPVSDEALLETPVGLLTEIERCGPCQKADS